MNLVSPFLFHSVPKAVRENHHHHCLQNQSSLYGRGLCYQRRRGFARRQSPAPDQREVYLSIVRDRRVTPNVGFEEAVEVVELASRAGRHLKDRSIQLGKY